VRYEPLPAILSIEDAIVQRSYLSGPARCLRGVAECARRQLRELEHIAIE